MPSRAMSVVPAAVQEKLHLTAFTASNSILEGLVDVATRLRS